MEDPIPRGWFRVPSTTMVVNAVNVVSVARHRGKNWDSEKRAPATYTVTYGPIFRLFFGKTGEVVHNVVCKPYVCITLTNQSPYVQQFDTLEEADKFRVAVLRVIDKAQRRLDNEEKET